MSREHDIDAAFFVAVALCLVAALVVLAPARVHGAPPAPPSGAARPAPAAPSFDHDTTRFPLTGMHLRVSCERCHSGGLFAGTPTDCRSCHAGA